MTPRLFAIIAASLLALVSAADASQYAEPKRATPPPSDNEQVNFITWNEDHLTALKTEIPEFEKRTGIKVNWTLLSEDAVRQKTLVDLASGKGEYDLVLTDVWIMPEHVYLGYLEPLGELIKNDPSFDIGVWHPKYIEGLTYAGDLYALPTESFGAALVYRKDLFEKHGVKVPQTVEELFTAAKILTRDVDGDKKTDLYGVVSRGKAGEEPAIIVSGFAWAFGGSWFEGGAATADEIRALKAKPAFNSPEFLAGFTAYTDLLKRYGPPNQKNYTWYEMIEEGKRGRVAMVLYSGFNVGALDRESVNIRSKYYAALPASGPAKPVQEAFVMGYGINKNSKNKKAAWEFLKFIAGEQFMSYVVGDYATSIAIEGLRRGDKYRKMHPYVSHSGNFVLDESVDMIDWRYMPRIPEYSVIASMLGKATSEVIAGKKKPKDALDHLNASVTKIMQRAGYYSAAPSKETGQ